MLRPSPCELWRPTENGEGGEVLGGPAEAASVLEEEDKDRDSARTRDEAAKAEPGHRRDLEEEQEGEHTQNLTPIEEEQVPGPAPAEEIGGDERRQEDMEEEHQVDNKQM